MMALLVFYSLGLLIPIAVGLREALRPGSRRLRLVRETADLL
jgi:hypothetical protein